MHFALKISYRNGWSVDQKTIFTVIISLLARTSGGGGLHPLIQIFGGEWMWQSGGGGGGG